MRILVSSRLVVISFCLNIEIGNREQADKLARWKLVAREATNDYSRKKKKKIGAARARERKYRGWKRKQRSTHLPIEDRRRKIDYASTKDPRDCSSRLSLELAGSVLLAPITWKLRSIVSWQATRTLVRARDFIVSSIEARFIVESLNKYNGTYFILCIHCICTSKRCSCKSLLSESGEIWRKNTLNTVSNSRWPTIQML